jgi:16S rRNA (uracil1498-N3)-methyltransferase
LIHVLRITPGDQTFVFDGCGRELRCTFRRVESNRAQLEIEDTLSDVVESPLQLTLVQAIAKGEKFDFIIQKATELGVSSIVPLITRYADVRLDDQQKPKRVERWRRISIEAMKQCGRRRIVEITAPRTLREYIAERESSAPAMNGAVSQTPRADLLFSERGGAAITDALMGLSSRSEIVAFIGPEGGWGEDELEALRDCGCRAVSLGPRILRTETASVVAITLIQHSMGDLSHRVAE